MYVCMYVCLSVSLYVSLSVSVCLGTSLEHSALSRGTAVTWSTDLIIIAAVTYFFPSLRVHWRPPTKTLYSKVTWFKNENMSQWWVIGHVGRDVTRAVSISFCFGTLLPLFTIIIITYLFIYLLLVLLVNDPIFIYVRLWKTVNEWTLRC